VACLVGQPVGCLACHGRLVGPGALAGLVWSFGRVVRLQGSVWLACLVCSSLRLVGLVGRVMVGGHWSGQVVDWVVWASLFVRLVGPGRWSGRCSGQLDGWFGLAGVVWFGWVFLLFGFVRWGGVCSSSLFLGVVVAGPEIFLSDSLAQFCTERTQGRSTK
jgi:hypothetical protein